MKLRTRSGSDNGGIALVIVMISIFVLTMLAAGFAYSMKVETRLAQNAFNEAELQWLGRSGVQYCRWILAQQLAIPNEPYDALNQVWAGGTGGMGTSNSPLAAVESELQLGHGSFTWKIVDLDRKANINTAGDAMLQQALNLMGGDAAEMTPIVNSILDWIDPDNRTRIEGTESDYYESLDPPYQAKNAPMDDISELMFVKGITPELYLGSASSNYMDSVFMKREARFGHDSQMPLYSGGLADLFTTMSSGQININTADSSVLQLIPGVDAIMADAIVSARGGGDDGSGMSGPFRNTTPNFLWTRVPGLNLEVARRIGEFCGVRSRVFEVQIDAQVGGTRRTYYAILGRNNPRDVQVLSFYWKM
jgi:general secretion pathway protein K